MPSVFSRGLTAGNLGHSNTFSVSGQKVVHFKDSNSNEQLQMDDRKNQVKSALNKLSKNAPPGSNLLADHNSQYKSNAFMASDKRRIAKKRFISGTSAEENHQGVTADQVELHRQIVSKSALNSKPTVLRSGTVDQDVLSDQPFDSAAKSVQGHTNKPVFGNFSIEARPP